MASPGQPQQPQQLPPMAGGMRDPWTDLLNNPTFNYGRGMSGLNPNLAWTIQKQQNAFNMQNPMSMQQGVEDYFNQDPYANMMQQNAMQQGNEWNMRNSTIGRNLDRMAQQAAGKNSIVQREALAQRQQAMGDIARQTAMSARGGMNPAMQRAAMMQQSQVGANMAAQVAAARAREQQEAQRAYLAARAQQQQSIGMAAQQRQDFLGGKLGQGSANYQNLMSTLTSGDERTD